MTTDSLTGADLMRAAGIEKMKEVVQRECFLHGLACTDDAVTDITTFALAAWEAHVAEQQKTPEV